MTHGSRPSETVMKALGAESAAFEALPAVTGGAWLLPMRHGPDLVVTKADAPHAEAARAAAECDVGPRVVEHVDGWLVCEWLVGAHLTPLEVRRPETLRELGSMLRRWHSCGITLPMVPMSESRQQYVASAGDRVFPALTDALDWADEVEATLSTPREQWVPAHLDVMANVLLTDHGVRLIDFEFARSAPLARELGQLVWEGELDGVAAERLVSGYLAGQESEAAPLVAAAATWCGLAAVTWTVWALARPGDEMARYARRSWERLTTHWARPGGL